MTAAIVIFGAAVGTDGQPSPTVWHRTRAAFDCGGIGARYIPTGAATPGRPSEASVMGRLLQEWGVPPDRIGLEETGTDTLSSATACAALLRNWTGPVRVATSAYHLRRCVWLLRLLGIPAVRCAPPATPTRPYWVLRDYAAVAVDVPLALWRRARS